MARVVDSARGRTRARLAGATRRIFLFPSELGYERYIVSANFEKLTPNTFHIHLAARRLCAILSSDASRPWPRRVAVSGTARPPLTSRWLAEPPHWMVDGMHATKIFLCAWVLREIGGILCNRRTRLQHSRPDPRVRGGRLPRARSDFGYRDMSEIGAAGRWPGRPELDAASGCLGPRSECAFEWYCSLTQTTPPLQECGGSLSIDNRTVLEIKNLACMQRQSLLQPQVY